MWKRGKFERMCMEHYCVKSMHNLQVGTPVTLLWIQLFYLLDVCEWAMHILDNSIELLQIIDHERPLLLEFPKDLPHLHDASR